MKERRKTQKGIVVFKYFIHGLGFSIVFTILFLFFMMSFIGALLGLISVLVLILFLGYANSFLTAALWTKMEPDWDAWGRLFLHGLVLFIVLLIVNLILEIPNLIVPSAAMFWVMLVGKLFADGFVAKNIGMWLCEYK